MATFTVAVSFHFDTEYEVEADNYTDAENLAIDLAEEWKPYSSDKGYTDSWYAVDIEGVHTNDDLDDEDE